MINNVSSKTQHDGPFVSVVGDTYRIIISGKESQEDYAVNDMAGQYTGLKILAPPRRIYFVPWSQPDWINSFWK